MINAINAILGVEKLGVISQGSISAQASSVADMREVAALISAFGPAEGCVLATSL